MIYINCSLFLSYPMAKEMFFIGMKITIPVTTSAKVAEGNPQMIFTESQTKEKAFDR